MADIQSATAEIRRGKKIEEEEEEKKKKTNKRQDENIYGGPIDYIGRPQITSLAQPRHMLNNMG